MDDYVIQAFFGLFIFLIIMFTAKYFYKRLVLSGKSGFARSRHMKSVDKLPLSNDKWLEIVEIGNEKLVIGVTQNNISILKTYGKEELCNAVTQESKNIFSEVLKKYFKEKP